MKVACLTSVHPRYDTRIFLKECRSLTTAGHDVTLIVADGKGAEMRDGVSIVDVGAPRGRLNRMSATVNQVYRAAAKLNADVYHLHDPELLRVAGKLCRLGSGKRVIFDSHEDVPRQILSKHWIPAPARKVVSRVMELVENHVVCGLAGVVAATPHIAERFKKINPQTVDINNFPMPDELAPVVHGRAERKRQICYVGGITRVRGIEPLLRALPFVPDVKLVLCGQFQEKAFETTLRALPGWRQVDYRGQAGRAEVRAVLSESMAGMVTLLPTPAYIDALPVKMFEYMSAELPVIASDFPLWQRIVDGARAGICVDPQSPEAIAQAIRGLLDDPTLVARMGRAGREAVLDEYNWPTEAAKLVAFYEKLA
jgi:glycosyltransferase involved in cell wall biosynthesis